MAKTEAGLPERAGTGVPGLDRILRGGLPRGGTYLVHGVAGTGKTTLSLQFLRAGADAGEKVLYVTLMQSRRQLEETARSHGWSLDGIEFWELPEHLRERAAAEQTVFAPSEVELAEVTDAILEGVDGHVPDRVVLDSVSELAVLAASPAQLRGPLVRIKDRLQDTGCTALFTSGELGPSTPQLRTILRGVIDLETAFPAYGPHRRRLRVAKMRAMSYSGGYHDYRIRTGGIEVYPRFEGVPQPAKADWSVIPSGIEGVDRMLGGGLEEGTACLITGTTGAGKSTLASLYVQAAAERGEKSLVFCFDERRETFLRRADSLDMTMPRYIEEGLVDLRQVAAGEMSSGEFAHAVRAAVDEAGVKVIVIDSISGYLSAMPEQELLATQLHGLLSYLSGAGVLTIMIMATHGLAGDRREDVDASYMADSVIVLRHFESAGEMRRCIAVLKKRHGTHEKTIREFEIAPGGCRVGEPLREFCAVLTGNPIFTGVRQDLLSLEEKPEDAQENEL